MKELLIISFSLLLISCTGRNSKSDAYGNFDVDGTIIAAKASGELLQFNCTEGDQLKPGQVIGLVDTTLLSIKKQQVLENIASMRAKISSAKITLQAQKKQVDFQRKEKNRLIDLYQKDATTEQQKDKMAIEYDVSLLKLKALEKDIKSSQSQLQVLKSQLTEINQKIDDCNIINPFKGRVLAKYKEPHEMVSAGHSLYKIASLSEMYIKVYVSVKQLDDIALGDTVTVLIDKNKKEYHRLSGRITWISETAEFTPKNIQTKEERVDEVYAVKVTVNNDGKIKIGMPGEVNFK